MMRIPTALAAAFAIAILPASGTALAERTNPFAASPDLSGPGEIAGPVGLRLSVYDARSFELFWNRVPGAIAYRLELDGLTVHEGDGVSHYRVADTDLSDDIDGVLNALDAAGEAVAERRFRISPGAAAPLVATDDAAPAAPPFDDPSMSGPDADDPDADGADGALAVRLAAYDARSFELFWERVPGAVRYRLSRDGRVVQEGDGVSRYVAGVDAPSRLDYALVALDAAGETLGAVRFAVASREGGWSLDADAPTSGPVGPDPTPGAGAADLRASLSEAMSGGRTLPYAWTWSAVGEVAGVRPGGDLRLFYTGRIVPAENRAVGDGAGEPGFWTREHVWPESWGAAGVRADLHNLVAADADVAAARAGRFLDEGGVAPAACTGCRIASATFEPPDEVKGDAARIAFYMDVRYEGGGTAPDLSLGDDPDAGAMRFGRLSTLLRWHCADPVSAEEVRRHEAIAGIQGNRNAFVDSPELVADVYGADCR